MTDSVAIDTVQDTTPPRYAGFNIRMFANMVDMAIVAFATDDLIDMVTDELFPNVDVQMLLQKAQESASAGADGVLARMIDVVLQQQVFEMIVFKNVFELACVALYTLPFWIFFSSTPGKMLLGLSIRDARTFERLTPKQSVQRFLGYIISFIPLALGFVWISMNKKRQGLHDLLAETVVIKVPRKSFTPTRQSAGQ